VYRRVAVDCKATATPVMNIHATWNSKVVVTRSDNPIVVVWCHCVGWCNRSFKQNHCCWLLCNKLLSYLCILTGACVASLVHYTGVNFDPLEVDCEIVLRAVMDWSGNTVLHCVNARLARSFSESLLVLQAFELCKWLW